MPLFGAGRRGVGKRSGEGRGGAEGRFRVGECRYEGTSRLVRVWVEGRSRTRRGRGLEFESESEGKGEGRMRGKRQIKLSSPPDEPVRKGILKEPFKALRSPPLTGAD